VPELPEVETIVREIRPALVGRALLSLRRGRKKLRRPWKADWDALLPGSRVLDVRRRGKWVVIDLDTGRRLVFHMGMTGQLVTTEADTLEPSHLHLVLGLDDGRQLRFRDIRRFGSAGLYDSQEALEAFFEQSGLGPEPWDLERRSWHERLSGTRRVLKAILLDQQTVAGVGNIYADEALFQARLHPTLVGNALRRAESERLRKGIVSVLERAIEKRGSTIRDYVGGSGLRGGFQEEFRVYGRAGEPCLRCKTPIVGIRLAGRATHYCPECQKREDQPGAHE
jgi:formamidopyrimidine-DNA glycosylase